MNFVRAIYQYILGFGQVGLPIRCQEKTYGM
jgi:hypothetical protein